MRVFIIGTGVVGLATGLGLARYGHEVAGYDALPETRDRARAKGLECKPEVLDGYDIYFVCTHENDAPKAVQELKGMTADIVVRSSVLPGTCRALANEMGRPILHNPEFLREATAEDDFLHTKVALIGRAFPEKWETNEFPSLKINDLYGSMNVRVVLTDSTVSELVKLAVNNYLTTLISYWNQVYLLCKELGINSHQVGRLAALDPRVVSYGAFKHGKAYGGKCLPKDLDQMIAFCEEKGVEPVLLEAVRRINQIMGGH